MNAIDVLECSWRELRRRKWRAAASTFGYLLAVAAMVIMVSGVRASRRAADAVLSTTGTHFIAFVPAGAPQCADCAVKVSEAPLEGFVAYGQATNILSFRVVERARALPTVADASPYLQFRFGAAGGKSVTVGGFDPRTPSSVGTTCCASTDLIAGRFLRPEEDGAVMLEEAYAAMEGLRPGDKVAIAGTEFPIVGVVNPGIRPAKADVYMHFADAERLINARLGVPLQNEANVILVEVADARVQDEAIRSVKALAPGIVVSSYACYKPAARVMGLNASAAWALTGALGALAVVLAMKSQLSAVLERRREVAILKAVGWTDGNVVREIMGESVIQAVAGGVLGCLVAAVVLALAPADVAAGGAAETVFSWRVFLAALLLAAAGGLAAGSLPAFLAARQRPAEALRRV